MTDSSKGDTAKNIIKILTIITVLVIILLAVFGKISWSDAVKIILALLGGGAALYAVAYFYSRAPASAQPN
jgi:type IV secretory pathway VirB2 component (pilin)